MPTGITILSKPTDTPYLGYVPCYNNQWFVASSTNTGQPNFKYYIVVTDFITGYSVTEKFLPNPSGKLQFDASKFSELLMTNYIPVNVYGFKQNSSIRKIRVNIGEIYGSTLPGAITSGTNIDYIVWNGSLELLTFSQYNSKNYTWDLNTNPNLNYPVLLSDLADDYTFNNRSNFLYWMMLEGQTDLPEIYVKTYNASGTLLNTYTITNSISTGSYETNMVCIDVGKKGIDGLNSSWLTGVEYYEIHAKVTSELPSFKIKKYTIKCSPRFDVYTLHYLSTTGAYETLHCSKVSELNSTKTSTTFKRSPWTNVSNIMTLDYSVAVEQPTIVNVQNGLKLNSDWVTKAELLKYKDLFSSPDVKLDLGTAQGYASVKVTNGTYVSKNNDKLKNLTFDLLFTHNNQRQKG
jgi:hypothetical protein